MKKNIYLLILVSVLLNFGCRKAKKNYDDYLPKIKTINAVVMEDGSVIVTGQIESSGDAPIARLGICCGTNANPTMLERQLVCVVSGDQFSGSYQQLSIDSSYNFRTWATNKYGYSYGNVINLSSVAPPSVTAPCTLPAESCYTGLSSGFSTYYGSPQICKLSSVSGLYEISANSIGTSVFFEMNSRLSVGVYNIATGWSPGYREMFISFVNGNNYILSSGKVYVNDLGGGLLDVMICDAPWQFTSSTVLHFKTHFTAKNI